MTGPRVLLMSLSVRTSAKGREYLSGYLGKARIVGFEGEPDKYGNPTWNIFVAEPEPRAARNPPRRPQERETASARVARVRLQALAPRSRELLSRKSSPFPRQRLQWRARPPWRPPCSRMLPTRCRPHWPPGCARRRMLQQRNELIFELGRLHFRDGSLRARARALIAAAGSIATASGGTTARSPHRRMASQAPPASCLAGV